MILDSNILIGYLNGDEGIISAVDACRKAGTVFFISSVSAIETLSLASLTPDKVAAVDAFLASFIVIPVDMRLVQAAGELRRKYRLDVPDAAVVATAVVNNLPLATRDKKMRSVPGIVLVDI